ncbi:MAG: hypothetical protein ABJD38_00770, partial [Aurantimonas coralicida]|jgi:hypothetical protein
VHDGRIDETMLRGWVERAVRELRIHPQTRVAGLRGSSAQLLGFLIVCETWIAVIVKIGGRKASHA